MNLDRAQMAKVYADALAALALGHPGEELVVDLTPLRRRDYALLTELASDGQRVTVTFTVSFYGDLTHGPA